MLTDREFTRRLLQTVLTVAGIAVLLAALWAAREALLLIYVSALIAMGFSPLVAQAVALWEKIPAEFNRLQAFLIRYKLMTRPITLAEAVQNAPSGSGSNAVGTVLVALSSLIGGVFGLITILILSFYLLIEAQPMFEYLVRFVPAGRRADVATAAREAVSKVSAWLRAQFVLAGVMGVFAAIGLYLFGVPYF